jgi:hypothetical protein
MRDERKERRSIKFNRQITVRGKGQGSSSLWADMKGDVTMKRACMSLIMSLKEDVLRYWTVALQLFVVTFLFGGAANAQSKLYVTEATGLKLSAINLATGSQSGSITVSNRTYSSSFSPRKAARIDATHSKIYWIASATPHAIYRSDLDGNNVQLFASVGDALQLDVDGANDRLYVLIDTGGLPVVKTYQLSTGFFISQFTTFEGSCNGPIRVSSSSSSIFYACPTGGKIYRVSMSGTFIAVIDFSDSPLSFAVDENHSKVFVTGFSTGSSIYSFNLDGSGETAVKAFYHNPGSIGYDPVHDVLLVTEDRGYVHRVFSMNRDGTNETTISEWRGSNGNGVGGAPFDGVDYNSVEGGAYWTDTYSTGSFLRKAPLDGTNVTTLFAGNMGDPRDVAYDVTANKIFLHNRFTNAVLGLTKNDVGGYDIANSGSPAADTDGVCMAVHPGSNTMYYTDNSSGGKILKGTVGSFSGLQTVYTTTQPIRCVAVDSTNGALFWTEGGATPRIRRSSLSGASVSTVYTLPIDSVPLGLTVHPSQEKIFFTDEGRHLIGVVNYDGSGFTDLVTTNVGAPKRIVVDPIYQRIIWTDFSKSQVNSAGLDGSNVTILNASSSISGPFGLTIFADTDSDGTADEVDQCPSDSSKVAPGQCGCGVVDTDSDSDGTANCAETCDDDSAKTSPGVCGCGVADSDADSDGTPDCNDQCDDSPAKTEPGICGCSTADADSDGDGDFDCEEACDTDSTKTVPGVCGCGVPDVDGNSNGTADCTDVAPNLSEPSIAASRAVVRVVLPKKRSISFRYTYRFLNSSGKVLTRRTGISSSGKKLSVSTPRGARTFAISYKATGPGYKDFQSLEYRRAIR